MWAPGGAWTIGYKAWGSLLARRLSKQGVLVACLDYRNFPQVLLLCASFLLQHLVPLHTTEPCAAVPARAVTAGRICGCAARQGTILDMLEDVNAGIGWTLAHAEEHGGDPQRTYLVGQSCGAQLAALALVTQARRPPRPCRLPWGRMRIVLHAAMQAASTPPGS